MFLSDLRLRTLCCLHVPQSEISMNQMTKMTGSEALDMVAVLSQDNVPLSEMDKAAVLTLIREEVRCYHTLNETTLISLREPAFT